MIFHWIVLDLYPYDLHKNAEKPGVISFLSQIFCQKAVLGECNRFFLKQELDSMRWEEIWTQSWMKTTVEMFLRLSMISRLSSHLDPSPNLIPGLSALLREEVPRFNRGSDGERRRLGRRLFGRVHHGSIGSRRTLISVKNPPLLTSIINFIIQTAYAYSWQF